MHNFQIQAAKSETRIKVSIQENLNCSYLDQIRWIFENQEFKSLQQTIVSKVYLVSINRMINPHDKGKLHNINFRLFILRNHKKDGRNKSLIREKLCTNIEESKKSIINMSDSSAFEPKSSKFTHDGYLNSINSSNQYPMHRRNSQVHKMLNRKLLL